MAIGGRRVGAFVVLAILVLTLSAGLAAAAPPTFMESLPPFVIPQIFWDWWLPGIILFIALFALFSVTAFNSPLGANATDKLQKGLLLLFTGAFAAGATIIPYVKAYNEIELQKAPPSLAGTIVGLWNGLFVGAGLLFAIVLVMIVLFILGGWLWSAHGKYAAGRGESATAQTTRLEKVHGLQARVRQIREEEEQARVAERAAVERLNLEETELGRIPQIIAEMERDKENVEVTIRNIRRALAVAQMLSRQPESTQKQRADQLIIYARQYAAVIGNEENKESTLLAALRGLINSITINERSAFVTNQWELNLELHLTSFFNSLPYLRGVGTNVGQLRGASAVIRNLANKIRTALQVARENERRLTNLENQFNQRISSFRTTFQGLNAALAGSNITEAQTQLNNLDNLIRARGELERELMALSALLLAEVKNVVALLNADYRNRGEVIEGLRNLGVMRVAPPRPAPGGARPGP